MKEIERWRNEERERERKREKERETQCKRNVRIKAYKILSRIKIEVNGMCNSEACKKRGRYRNR